MVNKKKYLIIGIVSIVLISIVGTLAWYTFGTKKSSLVLVLGNSNELLVTLSPYELKINAAPVTNYTSMSDYVSVTATNSKCYETGFSFYYDIESIDSGLASTSMKYAITRSTSQNGTYSLVTGGSGSFTGASAGSHKIVYYESIPANTTYYYKVYTYLDGNVSGSSSLQGKVLKTTFAADIDHFTVTFDPNGGSVGTTTKSITYGDNYGTLPTPTWSGHTFLGWNGKNMFNQDALLLAVAGSSYNNGYYTFTSSSIYGLYGANGNRIPITGFETNTLYTFTMRGHESGKDNVGGLYFRFVDTDGGVTGKTLTSLFDTTYTVTSPANKTVDYTYFTYGHGRTLYISYMQLEKSACATEFEPYYVTSSTKVTQMKNHTLKAIWS